MRVVLFSRRPRPGCNFSIELIVQELLAQLAPYCDASLAVCRFESSGVFPRVYNVVEAFFRRADVNHITGDVHYLTWLLPRKRTVLTIHDCGPIRGPMTLRKRVIRALWYRIPARQSTVITVVSETTKRELLQHIDVPADKVRIVPSFVPSLYTRIDRARPFDRERPVILQVGTGENKNILRLCEALRGLPCKLDIVGLLSDEQRAKLQECAIQYEQHVAVTTERMFELYRECDVVVFVSTFEGFGMPIVEGNLVGRPVVTSSVSSMPEVARDAACLVDPYDVPSIRAGVDRVLHDEAYRRELVERGFINAKRFEPSAVAAKYLAIYDELDPPKQRATALP